MFEPGEVVTAVVRDLGPVGGKRRPVLLVRRRPDGRWSTMLFTTEPLDRGGAPRRAVPAPASMGLRRDTFLWSRWLRPVTEEDVLAHVGWASDALVDAVEEVTGRSRFELAELRPTARADRRRAGRRAGRRGAA